MSDPRPDSAGTPGARCEDAVMDGATPPASGIAPAWTSRRGSLRGEEVAYAVAALQAQAAALRPFLDVVPLATVPALLAGLQTVTAVLHDAEGCLALRLLDQAAMPPARTP